MARGHVHGVGRITAALVGAPAAALLLLLGLCSILPLGVDARLLAFELLAVPALVTGACLALLSRSGTFAWSVSAALALLGAIPAVLP